MKELEVNVILYWFKNVIPLIIKIQIKMYSEECLRLRRMLEQSIKLEKEEKYFNIFFDIVLDFGTLTYLERELMQGIPKAQVINSIRHS